MRIYNRDPKTGRINRGHTALSREELQLKLWEKVEVDLNIPNGCWIYAGAKDTKGYGKFHIGLHKYVRAHRFFFSFVEELDPNKVIDHTCRNRACVNPAHLRQVDSRTNTLENSRSNGALNKVKTHCKWGHEFTPENTGINCNGGRWCKSCNRIRGTKNKVATKTETFSGGGREMSDSFLWRK